MASWGNAANQQYPQDMASPEGRTLTVDGVITASSSIQGNEGDLNLGTDDEVTDNVVIGAQGVTTKVQGNLEVSGNASVGNGDDIMTISSGANGAHVYAPLGAHDSLHLNDDAPRETGDVIISHPDNVGVSTPNVIVQSPRLRIGTNQVDGKIDANGLANLKLGSDNLTNHVEIGRTGQFATLKGLLKSEEHIRVGTGGDGKVDGGGANAVLKLGTDAAATDDVEIGRSGHEVDVNGRLNALEHIRVGTGANDGKVDAADDARNLKLGTDADYTNHVIIGRAGRTVEITGGKIWLNAAHTFCLDLNEAGQNPGHPSIDVYISGAVEAYIDDQGIHNA